MRFLYRPTKDAINQTFGSDPAYYAKLGQKGHPGLDFGSSSGTPLYAPCDGDYFYTSDKYGGVGFWCRYPNNEHPIYNIILWHIYPREDAKFHPLIPSRDGVVTNVKAGTLIAYTDNSGFPKESTGPHLHLGVMPCDNTGAALNPNNGFDGCVDPTPFLFDIAAQDLSAIDAAVESSDNVVQAIVQSPYILTTPQKQSLLDALKAFLIKVATWMGFPQK